MKNTLTLLIIFLFAFIVFCTFTMPAAVLLQVFKGQLPNNLQLGAVNGSVWDGQVSGVRFNNIQLNQVKWEIEPAALILGELAGNIKFGNPRDTSEISGKASFSSSLLNRSVSVSNASLRFSVEQAMDQVTLPLPVDAKGRVIVNIKKYQSGAPYCNGLNGEISSPNIDVKGMNGWFSIGDLSGQLDCKSGDIAVVVDPENRLGLQADATLAANFQFRVAGNIKPEASLPKEVHDAVKFLGRPDADGRYPVNL
ncbi:type II secretion system protein N [Pseudoalteromonas sp. McH1-7]|uniref:Type II secretion system protein N n=1 Tax=Pseudoalteromonas peptidolytica F12-50-A1 TaxID=1315280 RepID=A0A8I0MXL6_9GAMM|nr:MULTISPECIES: type II secretion system protein N [Pseudoalteromonas]MBE0347765.1 general secretion pathway protein N [Pseudoalteromonas peptidolytica F12-50-A1]MDW7551488.1 type II secretion system protein N [Pseudoalteromonas peptidolytica]NLR16847.1 type II secretion system protein N [Pseudoalteromonas peptidolytica]NUZ13046.1 type II secretion system protein N [Pseudoalteromonas sp. McH1-7]RRS07243.1 type II secretion system protein N [Pseudoalteromonas sp. J010]